MNFDHNPASLLILGAIIVISALALWVAPAIMDRNLLRPYWLLKRRQYDTIVTSGFIHGDLAHLFFNSLALFSFGPHLERKIGTPKFVALYFIGLVLSSLGSVYKQRNNPDYAALGASGAILAVVFASVVYYPTDIIFLFFVPMPAWVFALVFAGYSLWASKNRRDNIAHDAHLDGAFIGLVFVGLTDFPAWSRALHQVFG
jgi:membrane associated rhomboid family serine protease